MALPRNDRKEGSGQDSTSDESERKAPEGRGAVAESNPKLEDDGAGRRDGRTGKKSKRSKKEPERELTLDEAHELREKKKRNKVVALIVTAFVLIAAISVFILTVDVGKMLNYDSEGRDALEDGGQTNTGQAPLDDEGTSGSVSSDPEEMGFPVSLPEYLQQGYSSTDNANALSSYESDWQNVSDWEINEEYYSIDDSGYSLKGDNIEWNRECEAPVDNRRGTDFKEVEGGDKGWIYRDNAECNWADGEIVQIAGNWPSREMGYTNNPDLEMTEDIGLNPFYSYVLKEDVQWFFGHNLQRILNPVYGTWSGYHQKPTDETVQAAVRDVFTEDWWENNIENGDPSNLPIYADWNNDNYGGIENIGTFGWFGEISEYDLSVVEHEDRGSVIEGTLYLEYSMLSGEEVISQDAELDIQIVPNTDDLYDVNNRMVINNAELRINN